jgi:mortality factor 4-like protein 1
MAPQPSQQYKKDDKVLCFHHELLYEAKISEHKQDGGSHLYKVHYKGWKNT